MTSRMRFARKTPFGLALAGVMLLLAAAAAEAANGTGSFTGGYEIPSSNVTISQGLPQCATFHASTSDPTIHVLPMTTGSFGLANHSGGGTATFTITNTWYAGPTGTKSSSTCANGASVSGTLSVDYEDWSCATGTGTYTRTGNTSYTLTGTVVCDNLDTGTVETTPITVTYTGTQQLCGTSPQPTCNHVDAGTNLSGNYAWSTP